VRKKSASSTAVLFYLVNLIAIAILEGRLTGATPTMAEHKLTADQRSAMAFQMKARAGANGFPELESWEAAGSLRFQADWQGKNADPGRATEVSLLWTTETLYLRFRAKYRVITVFPDAEPNGRRDQLWDRDVAEVFLQPNESDRRRYKEFEISPNGMWIDLDIAPGEKHDLRSALRRRVTLNETSKIWVAELALPMKSLVERFDPTASWRVNFYRVEGASEPRFYSAWQPTGTPMPNFHVPEAFGTLIFVDSAAAK
jgi:alpha-galactosidase